MRHYTLIISFREKESERREKQFNCGHSGPFKKKKSKKKNIYINTILTNVTRWIDIFLIFASD